MFSIIFQAFVSRLGLESGDRKLPNSETVGYQETEDLKQQQQQQHWSSARKNTTTMNGGQRDFPSSKSGASSCINNELNLGKLGSQAYMTPVGGSGSASLTQPIQVLQILAEQRGGSYKQQHVWGSPLSIGLCHLEFTTEKYLTRNDDEKTDEMLTTESSSTNTNNESLLDMFESGKTVGGGAGGVGGVFSRSNSLFNTSNNCGGNAFGSAHYGSVRNRKTLPRRSGGKQSTVPEGSTAPHAASAAPPPPPLRVPTPEEPGYYRGGLELDHLQAEWSPTLASFIVAFKR